jgi:hypothetical protein
MTWWIKGPALCARHQCIPGTGEIRVYVPVCTRSSRPQNQPTEVRLLGSCIVQIFQVTSTTNTTLTNRQEQGCQTDVILAPIIHSHYA